MILSILIILFIHTKITKFPPKSKTPSLHILSMKTGLFMYETPHVPLLSTKTALFMDENT